MIIVFDGPDGVGKTAQLQLTADYLRSSGKDVHTARASGGTPIGEELRKVSLSPIERPVQTDLYISLAMHTALGFDLQERKQRGQICLVDRSPLAMLAYNVIAGKLPEPEAGYKEFEAMLKLWAIDSLIVFTATPQVIEQRRQERATTDHTQATNYYENKDQAFHVLVRKGYQIGAQLIRDHPEWGINLIEINATPSIEQVQATVRQKLAL